jgi:hypothetical protein
MTEASYVMSHQLRIPDNDNNTLTLVRSKGARQRRAYGSSSILRACLAREIFCKKITVTDGSIFVIIW